RPTSKCLLNKRGNDHSITPGLSRSDSVKKPDDRGGKFFLSPISQSQELINGFRAGIAPSTLGGSAHNEIAIFAKGHVSTQAVHLRSRSNQHSLVLLVCQS